jgi:hypothetical protein
VHPHTMTIDCYLQMTLNASLMRFHDEDIKVRGEEGKEEALETMAREGRNCCFLLCGESPLFGPFNRIFYLFSEEFCL